MPRNTYLSSPGLLGADYAMLTRPNVYFAGQMTGVEGYVESAGSGLIAGMNAARRAKGLEPLILPRTTMIGAMAQYVQNGSVSAFTPMNANFGIIQMPDKKVKGGKAARNAVIAQTAISTIEELLPEINA
jgi:methylenetetrahydrofolate--tRNA-(uracil-5-)-methyltransferase